MPDPEKFYPLRQGLQLFYQCEDPELPTGRGVVERIIRQVEERDAGVVAAFDEILRLEGGREELRQFEVLASLVGIREGGRWILNAPLVAGQSWEDGADRFEIVAVGDGVRVPAGSFGGCLRVTYNNEDTGGGILWFAPDIGLVKVEQYGERGPYTWALESANNQSILYRR